MQIAGWFAVGTNLKEATFVSAEMFNFAAESSVETETWANGRYHLISKLPVFPLYLVQTIRSVKRKQCRCFRFPSG